MRFNKIFFKVLDNINLNDLISLADKGDKTLEFYKIRQFEEIINKDIIINKSSLSIIGIESIIILE